MRFGQWEIRKSKVSLLILLDRSQQMKASVSFHVSYSGIYFIWFSNNYSFFSASNIELCNGQGGLACCDSWGRKELNTTEWLNWTEWFPILLTLGSLLSLVGFLWNFFSVSLFGYGIYFQQEVLLSLFSIARVLSPFSRVQLLVTLWTVARQAPLSMGFSKQEYWRGLPCPPSGDLPGPRNQTPISYVSCTLRCVLYHQCHLGSPCPTLLWAKCIPW